MKRKHLLPLLLFVTFLFTAGIASAYPYSYENFAQWRYDVGQAYINGTWLEFMGAHTGPTYYTITGGNNTNTVHYNARIFIDPTRDLNNIYPLYSHERPIGRSFYAEYVSGNILGDKINIPGIGYEWYGDGENLMVFEDSTSRIQLNTYPYNLVSSMTTWDDYFKLTGTNINQSWINMKVTDVQSGSSTQPVPEPTTCMLVASGLAGLGFIRRKSRSR